MPNLGQVDLFGNPVVAILGEEFLGEVTFLSVQMTMLFDVSDEPFEIPSLPYLELVVSTRLAISPSFS